MSEPALETVNPETAERPRKAWVAPVVTFDERLEVIAAVCSPGKGAGIPTFECTNNPNS